MRRLLIRSSRVALAEGVGPATLVIRDGKFERILRRGERPAGEPDAAETIDAGDLLVTPGIVDSHVHVNEPGRTEWEGFETATRAAAAGGVTTLVDMPLNSVPATTTIAALEAKRAAAAGRCHVDVGFWGGVVPGNAADVAPLYEAGALGFKCFLVPSGVDEFQNVTEQHLRAVLPTLSVLDAVLLVHAEVPEPIEQAVASAPPPWKRYEAYLASRPDAAEVKAIEMMVRLAREFHARIHIVHVATADALSILRAAQQEGLSITGETCPHYLYFSAEDVPDGATEYKCAPPIRSRRNNLALFGGLEDGTLSLVASDHSPAPPAMKRREEGDFATAWGGIASLQLTLAATWTVVRSRDRSIEDLVRWQCEGPARLAQLASRKGRIAEGMDADVVIWDPEARFTVDPAMLHHRHPLTPYAGHTLNGVVHKTLVRGQTVYDRASGFALRASGRLLARDGL